MPAKPSNAQLLALKKDLNGALELGSLYTLLYATDASAYQETPLAVAFPKDKADIAKLIQFAQQHKTSLIPRTAGTSLAGQVVGDGIIVDVSKHFTKIIELNTQEGWVMVEPGVVRDELNAFLKPHGLFFGPETSTSNRCMVGGMLGNNSCGSRSLVYGSTREHTIAVEGFLADGTFATFGDLSPEAFKEKIILQNLEGSIYRETYELLKSQNTQNKIWEAYPKANIPRRNTGYALDLLLNNSVFDKASKKPFNMCQLLAGSEGTLFFSTAIKLNVVKLPPKHAGVVAIHCQSVSEALDVNLEALKFDPTACELMDHYILECTKENSAQAKNRLFIQGDPKAILVVEFAEETKEDLIIKAESLEQHLRALNMAYHFPLIVGKDVGKVWDLRKAGLGLLSNIPGDAKPAPVIEDTAVDVQDLPQFIADFNETLQARGLHCVHYAHAATGELHLRPILNLKTAEGKKLFRLVAQDIAELVKAYKGSLSGEHGDGRLRGEFIEYMYGKEVYQLILKTKEIWDKNHIFNPGKITQTPPMDESLRYLPGQETPEIETAFRYPNTKGFVRAIEMCNGSGDCRKSHLIGGTMCPSFMATRNEKDTTRGRANVLRHHLSGKTKPSDFSAPELKEVLDLCLSCKGCKSECPSNVDMAKLKAETYHQIQQQQGISFKTKMFGRTYELNKLAAKIPHISNWLLQGKLTAPLVKKTLGIHPKRSMPKYNVEPFTKWFAKQQQPKKGKPVYLFADEFLNYTEADILKDCYTLLNRLGYYIMLLPITNSARALFSKGMLTEAKKVVNENLLRFQTTIDQNIPIVGIEPSCILSFRDEYPDICAEELIPTAKKLKQNSFLFEEFFANEIKLGNITSSQFNQEEKELLVHGHCHQKALSDQNFITQSLGVLSGAKIKLLATGCCGMAGSFGYEKEHYDISQNIAELVLFPSLRAAKKDNILIASGTSCRHQVKDGLNKVAVHPIKVLLQGLV